MLNLQSIYFGQRHLNFDNVDYDVIRKISRLAKKHNRYCEMACNGEGYLNGEFYNVGNKNAYISEDTTVFDLAIDKIEEKIIALTDKRFSEKLKTETTYNGAFFVKFQHDPRGNTVKLQYEGDNIEL